MTTTSPRQSRLGCTKEEKRIEFPEMAASVVQHSVDIDAGQCVINTTAGELPSPSDID